MKRYAKGLLAATGVFAVMLWAGIGPGLMIGHVLIDGGHPLWLVAAAAMFVTGLGAAFAAMP